MSSQALKGLAIMVAGILISSLSTSSLASYCAIAWGGFLFMRGLSESSGE